MLIGILSDTHDKVQRTIQGVDLLIQAGAEVLIHCGDLTSPEIVHLCGLRPTYFVFGNNDFDETALKAAIAAVDGVALGDGAEIQIDGRRIAVTHGHLPRTTSRLAAQGPDYLLRGHSHQVEDLREGPTRWINPGALHAARVWTVALLETRTDVLSIHEVC